MEKEDIAALAQLLKSMEEAVDKLEKAQKDKDLEELQKAKKEILLFQKKVDELL